VDVNVPGVMAILVVPAAAQLSVLLAPEFMLVGSAVKELIVGAESFPDAALDEVIEPQAARPAQATRTRASEQRSTSEELSPRELRLFLQTGLVRSMHNPQETQFIAHAVVVVALRGPSPLDRLHWFVNRVIRVIRRSTIGMVRSWDGSVGWATLVSGAGGGEEWWRRVDSNHGPTDYETVALAT
jgi:hypothetical protein